MATKAELEAEVAELRSRVWTLHAVARSLLDAAGSHNAAMNHLLDASQAHHDAVAMLMADDGAPDA